MPDHHAPLSESRPVVGLVGFDASSREGLRVMLERAGYRPLEHTGAAATLDAATAADAVLMDLGPGEAEGLALLARLSERDPELPVITIDRDRGPQAALEALRRGAYDHLVRPLTDEQVLPSLKRASERRRLARRLQRLEGDLDERRGRNALIGQSALIRSLVQQIERLRDSDVPVCIVGETGTGKQLVARAIHDLGSRRSGPFVALNCAAVTAPLQESELFGQERPGAPVHRGCFERADGGSLFLDEVADLDPATQAALLRSLQEGTVRRVGGTNEVPVDVRVISATSRRLEDEVRDHRFREDLFYRLHVYPLYVPPLRERKEDIPLLVAHFMERLRHEASLGAERVSAEALDALLRHDWPGNVRELQNLVHRAMLACDGREIGREHLPAQLGAAAAAPLMAPAATDTQRTDKEVVPLRELERREIMKALSTTGGSVAQAARRLGIGRATLYRRLSELNLPPPTVALRNALASSAASTTRDTDD